MLQNTISTCKLRADYKMGCEIGQNILSGSKYSQLKRRKKSREFRRHFDEKLRSFLKCQGYESGTCNSYYKLCI